MHRFAALVAAVVLGLAGTIYAEDDAQAIVFEFPDISPTGKPTLPPTPTVSLTLLSTFSCPCYNATARSASVARWRCTAMLPS